jgi:hypothetical protein
VADFLLVILTVFAVGVGGYHLGRLGSRDREDALLDDLDDANALIADLLRTPTHPTRSHLRAVQDEQP